MNYSSVIFDLDGTLLNSLTDLADAMNHVLAKRGYKTHDENSYKNFIGDGLKELVRRALPKDAVSDDLVHLCLFEMEGEYSGNWDNKTKLYEGVADLLDGLAQENVKLAILSNKPHSFVEKIYGRFLNRWTFEIMLGAGGKFPRKPDPSGALHIARALDANEGEVVFLGDSKTDMLTAKNAGMVPVGALWGYSTREELNENGAAFLIERPTDLLSIIF